MSKRATPTLFLTLSHLSVAVIAAFGIHQWLVNSEPQADASPSAVATVHANEPPLFRVGEREYHYHQLPIEYRQPLYEIRKFAFEQQLLLIEDALVEAYIQQQMASSGENRMQVQNRLLPGSTPTESEVEAFYRENQSLSAPPLEQMREELVIYLTATKQETLKKQLLTRLLVEGKAQLLAEAPQLNPTP